MKNLLIISYSYPPAQSPAAQRPYYLAKYLNRENWNISVLTPKVSDSSMGHSDRVESINNVKVILTRNINISYLRKLKENKKIEPHDLKRNSFLKSIKQSVYSFIAAITIPDKGIVWVPFAVIKGYLVIKSSKTIVIFTTSPLFSNHLVGLILKKLLKACWIADFRDFHYVENQQKSKLLRRHIDRWLEENILKNADKVLFIAESMKNEYCEHYPSLRVKAHAVYNGFEPENSIKNIELSNDKPLTIFYAGSFYAGERSPFSLLDTLDMMIKEGEIDKKRIRIKIAGSVEKSLAIRMSNYEIFDCIDFLGVIKREQVLIEMRRSHLLWLIVGNTKKHYMGFPIKGYEYIAAQRNILAFVPSGSEAEHIITHNKLGFIMNSEQDTKSLKKNRLIFSEIISKYQTKKLNRPIPYNRDILDLTKMSQISKIEQIMDSLI